MAKVTQKPRQRGATFVAPNIDLSPLDSIVRIGLGNGGGTLPILDSLDLDQRPGVSP